MSISTISENNHATFPCIIIRMQVCLPRNATLVTSRWETRHAKNTSNLDFQVTDNWVNGLFCFPPQQYARSHQEFFGLLLFCFNVPLSSMNINNFRLAQFCYNWSLQIKTTLEYLTKHRCAVQVARIFLYPHYKLVLVFLEIIGLKLTKEIVDISQFGWKEFCLP